MWREGYVPGGRTRFFCRAMGHGDDLVLLLHGWPEDGSAWRLVAPALAAEGLRVVAVDLKGYGRSDAPDSGYDPETLADEIAQLIRNLHVKKATVVGHDWGGAVALATAFRHPGHVSNLVLMSSPYRQLDLRSAWHIPQFNLPLLPQIAFRHRARPLVRTALRFAAVQDEPFTDDVVDRYAKSVAAHPKAWLAYYRSMSRQAVKSWAARKVRKTLPWMGQPTPPNRLRMPTTVVWGSDDRVTPLHLGERVAYDLQAELVALDRVGHFPHEEAPEEVVAAVLKTVRQAA